MRFTLRGIILYSQYYNFDSSAYYIGGVETYLRNLAGVMTNCGITPYVIVPDVESRRVDVDGTTVIGVKTGKNWKRDILSYAMSLGDLQRDLLIFGSSTLIQKHSFRHSLAIQHGIYWDVETIHNMKVVGRVMSTTLRAIQAKRQLEAHSLVSRMVCVDLNYVNWMRALCVANRLPYTYIPNFADTSVSVPERSDDGKLRIVFARRFEPIRGCALLMQVIPQVLAEHDEIELAIAGSGSMEAELHNLFDDDPRVMFTRYDANESIAFHGRFDIALVPSVASEGTSLSLLEAMAAGCAVVTTDVGGMSNVILNGHNGILVRPEATELHRGLTSLIVDAELRKRLARNARQTVEDSFSRDRWARGWAGVFGQFI